MNIANYPSPNEKLVWVNNTHKKTLIELGFNILKSHNHGGNWIFLVNRKQANEEIEKQQKTFLEYRKKIGLI